MSAFLGFGTTYDEVRWSDQAVARWLEDTMPFSTPFPFRVRVPNGINENQVSKNLSRAQGIPSRPRTRFRYSIILKCPCTQSARLFFPSPTGAIRPMFAYSFQGFQIDGLESLGGGNDFPSLSAQTGHQIAHEHDRSVCSCKATRA